MQEILDGSRRRQQTNSKLHANLQPSLSELVQSDDLIVSMPISVRHDMHWIVPECDNALTNLDTVRTNNIYYDYETSGDKYAGNLGYVPNGCRTSTSAPLLSTQKLLFTVFP